MKAAGVAILTAAMFSSVYAAGLGKLTVLSGLGQPLNAEIELTSVGRDEASGLAVRLAPLDEFRRANIELNPALFALRFAVEQRGTRHVVRITSTQPLNEPFVDMLLEVSSANSKLVREYTFLLDPPELRRVQPAQTAQAAPAAAPPMAQAATRQSAAALATNAARQASQPQSRAQGTIGRPAPASAAGAPATAPAAINNDEAKEVLVRRGDTLHKIAAGVKPEGVSLDQMLVALYRANPDAFIGENMNRLRAGQILKVPDSTAASAVSQGEARGVIVAQAADFNAYRDKLAGQVTRAASAGTDQGRQTAGGQITARVEEQATPANTARDRLTVSRSGLSPDGAAAEDRIAADKAVAEAQARVRELEKNLGDLQKLLELKNKEMAALQQAAGNAGTAVSGTGAIDGTGAPAAAAAVAGTLNAGSAASGTPAAIAATPPTPAAKPKLAPPAPPPPPPTLIEELLDNPLMLGAGGLLVALLGVVGIRLGRKRRERQMPFGESTVLADTAIKTNSLFGSTGGQSVDTTNSVFNSNFTPSSSQLDSNEVDPVAEADVYIAYGRDAQAEEILKEALRTQPNRHSVRVKLLEIYASRKDLRAFETVASELYSMTRGEGPDWAQAVQLGATVDPANPLYASAGKPAQPEAAAPAAAAGLAAASSPGPADLDLDALLNTTTGGIDHVAEGDGAADEAHPLMFDDDPVPQTDVSPVASAPEPQMQGDGNLVDFSVAPGAAKPVPAEIPVEPDDGNTLDFEFDLGDMTAKHADAAPGSPVPTASTDALAGAKDLAADAQKESAALDFNFDLLKPVQSKPLEALPILDGPVAHDESADLDFKVPAVPELSNAALPDRTPVPVEFDLSSISLELDAPASVAESAVATPVLPVVDTAGGNAEMATKLDLAMAYQEMGDAEGARELLDEVLKGGTPDQVQKAKTLMSSLA